MIKPGTLCEITRPPRYILVSAFDNYYGRFTTVVSVFSIDHGGGMLSYVCNPMPPGFDAIWQDALRPIVPPPAPNLYEEIANQDIADVLASFYS